MDEFALGVLRQMTPGAWGIWALVGVVVVGWFKFRTEIRKIESGDDTSLRRDLLERIATLEKRDAERERALNAQIAKCDEEQAVLKAQISGLHRQIIEMAKYLVEVTGTAAMIPPATKAMIEKMELGE